MPEVTDIQTEEVQTTKVKMLVNHEFKGVTLAKGLTVDVERHVAERLISEGHAEAVIDAEKTKGKAKSGRLRRGKNKCT